MIAITESWATPEISDTKLGLDGFVLFRKDRSAIRVGKGGGVLLYVSNELRCVACLLYTSDAADDLLCVDLGGRRIIKKH